MSSSAEIRVNGNGHADHDHILRPRAVKPTNQAVLRTLGEEGYLSVNGTDNIETGISTGQTR